MLEDGARSPPVVPGASLLASCDDLLGLLRAPGDARKEPSSATCVLPGPRNAAWEDPRVPAPKAWQAWADLGGTLITDPTVQWGP